MNSNPDHSNVPSRISLETFQALVENGFDVVLILDTQGLIKYISPSIRFVLGFTPQEREGQSALELISPDDQTKVQSLLLKVRAKSRGRAYAQLDLRHKDGSWRTVEVMAQNLLDDPSIEGIVVNYRDITERLKTLEALRISEMRYNKAFSASPDAIALNYINSGRFLEVNHAFERITGYAHDEVIGRTAIDLGLWKDAARRKEIIDVLAEHGWIRDYEAEFVGKNGEEKTCIVSAETIELAGEPCMLSVTRDVTLQKAAALELKEAADRLRADHRDLAEKDAALKQILNHLDQEKSSYRHNFASNAKNLLTPIITRLKESGGHLSPTYVARLEDALQRIVGEDVEDHAHNMSTLTGREIDVCELIRQGLSSKEIAEKLSLSPQTVHKHRRTIRKKLQLDNKRINLAAYLRSR